MQIHLVLGLNGPESIKALEKSLEREYPEHFIRLTDRPAWLVADDDFAESISAKLGMTVGDHGIAGLVVTVADYFGRADTKVWAWMKRMYERPARSLSRAEEGSPVDESVDVAATTAAT